MERVVDEHTGLSLALPSGWRRVPTSAFPLVLVETPPRAGRFTANAVATVVALADDDIATFTERSTIAWSHAMEGTIVHVGTAPVDDVDGREVWGLYREGSRTIGVHSLLFAHDGRGTRIDVSFGIWDAPEAVTIAPALASRLRLPTAVAEPASAEQLDALWEEVRHGAR